MDASEKGALKRERVPELERSRIRSLAISMTIYGTAMSGFGWAIQAHAGTCHPRFLHGGYWRYDFRDFL